MKYACRTPTPLHTLTHTHLYTPPPTCTVYYIIYRSTLWPSLVWSRQRGDGLGWERQRCVVHLWTRNRLQVPSKAWHGPDMPGTSGKLVKSSQIESRVPCGWVWWINGGQFNNSVIFVSPGAHGCSIEVVGERMKGGQRWLNASLIIVNWFVYWLNSLGSLEAGLRTRVLIRGHCSFVIVWLAVWLPHLSTDVCHP